MSFGLDKCKTKNSIKVTKQDTSKTYRKGSLESLNEGDKHKYLGYLQALEESLTNTRDVWTSNTNNENAALSYRYIK